MPMTQNELREHRVLILAPIGRDGPALKDLLGRIDIGAQLCATLDHLAEEIDCGAGAVLLAEEALFGKPIDALSERIDNQPPWSDLPFLLITSRQEQTSIAAWRERLIARLKNVSLLDRPLQGINLTSAVQAACRARARQYEVRDHLEIQVRAAQELEALVSARTRELEQANAALVQQMAERERAEQSLRQVQRMEGLGRLTGGVAHDFNNLLMVLSGGIDVIGRAPDEARRQALLGEMRRAIDRGARLTHQLLSFSRRQELRPEPIDVRRKIEGMRELLQRSLRGDIQVRTDFAESLWPVEVDPGELELVILNLAVNARDAMPEGGTITLRAENASAFKDEVVQGDFVALSVRDTGIGMAPDIVAQIFEPFFTTKEVGKGSGLGLPQVYGFVRQSNGTVHVQSAPRQGTTVTLYLPRSRKVPAADVLYDTVSSPVRPAARLNGHVLMVEDDEDVAALVLDMLGQLGLDVTRVASGAAALGALSNGRKIDVLFSDVIMPGGMNGIELVREARRRRPTLPVVLTSGYTGTAQTQAASEGLPLLNKPFGLNDLAEVLRAAIDGRHQLSGESLTAPARGAAGSSA
jgi:signal transduction histidine kinase/ActR/RegA family two-component response regulator